MIVFEVLGGALKEESFKSEERCFFRFGTESLLIVVLGMLKPLHNPIQRYTCPSFNVFG